jgi:type 1 glutamine amidotransferase
MTSYRSIIREGEIVVNLCLNARWIIALFVALSPCQLVTLSLNAQEKEPLWVVYDGFAGPGKGKHIVLVSGDEEYRSEEALPQLGKILARHHGFKCTVLFAIDPKTGEINPNVNNNIPGLENLKTADLMIIATRFRNLPEEQMKYIAEYVEAGKPVIGMRTATHAFNGMKGKFAKYNWNNGDKNYKQGFGRQILGETWVSHHGNHGSQSTRGILAKGKERHPILKGIKDGDIWGPTDVYGATPLAPSEILVYGQVLVGMKSTDKPLEGKKNDPMMPIAWTRTLPPSTSGRGAGGEGNRKAARVFTTTMGASQDLESEGTRRMLVNAAYWTLGMEDQLPNSSKVDLVGNYRPTRFSFNGYTKGVRPAQHLMK